jgi:hypothetical protein
MNLEGYEKIIKWEKRPRFSLIGLAIFMIVTSSLFIVFLFVSPESISSTDEPRDIVFASVLLSSLFFFGWMIIMDSIGKNKREIWQKVKTE